MSNHDNPTPRPEAKLPLVIGITGASGAIYGVRLIEILHSLDVPVHLVVSKSAAQTIQAEVGVSLASLRDLVAQMHSNMDIGASIASGSFQTAGMIVAPCSVKTLSNIAYGATDTLIARAADVVLKERRRLVLMFRETPLHTGHIRSMQLATENGAIIAPPVPAFYALPTSVDDIVNHTVGRVLDLFGVHNQLAVRWKGAR